MGLAQKIALAVMLDNDPALIAEQGFAVYPTLGGGWCCVFFSWRCRAVIRT